ncbi:hypothetical protein [Breznakiella homolactica]|uniref:Band 7 domain-containing protein n=1 Tax=Breznakiella homolactica TaxID=2798577 RepID=A0A7T8B968_9SPIR|nr:hypothetical protein [Breznakiella homolactica]QQO08147.1 hypothetical protein JFL75_14525 [Breznakiella homolactica]
MRKVFIVLFIILIILAGVGFVFGWTQLTVPPGSYGIMRTKTHGIDPEIIRDGKFRWVWYKLIPTNAVISVFSLDPVNRQITAKGSLPSGETYASLVGLSMDFTYEVSGSLSFNIRPDALISLMNSRNIGTQDELDAYESRLADDISAFTVQRLRVYAEDQKKMEEILAVGSVEGLKAEIEGAFPDIENLSLIINVARFPDFLLYESARSLYGEYLDRQRSSLTAAAGEAAESHITSRLRFDELEKYGELLTKYPVLLQYLALESGSGAADILRSAGGQ